MINKKHIPLEQFTVLIPNPTNRLTVTSVTIYENGRFNMNSRLAENLGGKKLAVSFTADANHFALKEDGGTELIYFPKSGSKRLETVSTLLGKSGITFPAKYDVWYNEAGSFWQGDLLINPMTLPSKRRHSSKKSS